MKVSELLDYLQLFDNDDELELMCMKLFQANI